MELFSMEPRILMDYRISRQRNDVMEAIKSMEPDAFVVSGIHVLPFVPVEYPVIYDAHNIEWKLSEGLFRVKGTTLPVRLHRYITFMKLRRAEERIIRQVECIVACSDTDAAYFSSLRQASVPVVMNGVDTDFWKVTREPEPGLVLFSGDMSYYPNIDAAVYLVREVLPVLLAGGWKGKLVLCGRNPVKKVLDLASPQVEVTGSVPDMRPYYARASVLAAPMRIGSGTPLKVITAMAAGIPVVTTSRVAASLGLEKSECLKLAESPEELSRSIIEIISNRQLSFELSQASIRAVQRRFSRKACSRRFWSIVDEYLRVMHERPSPLLQHSYSSSEF